MIEIKTFWCIKYTQSYMKNLDGLNKRFCRWWMIKALVLIWQWMFHIDCAIIRRKEIFEINGDQLNASHFCLSGKIRWNSWILASRLGRTLTISGTVSHILPIAIITYNNFEISETNCKYTTNCLTSYNCNLHLKSKSYKTKNTCYLAALIFLQVFYLSFLELR